MMTQPKITIPVKAEAGMRAIFEVLHPGSLKILHPSNLDVKCAMLMCALT